MVYDVETRPFHHIHKADAERSTFDRRLRPRRRRSRLGVVAALDRSFLLFCGASCCCGRAAGHKVGEAEAPKLCGSASEETFGDRKVTTNPPRLLLTARASSRRLAVRVHVPGHAFGGDLGMLAQRNRANTWEPPGRSAWSRKERLVRSASAFMPLRRYSTARL